MDLVVPKNSLAVAISTANLVADIEARLLKIPNFMQYKDHMEFVALCCELCEAAAPSAPAAAKQEMAVTILTTIFNYTPEESAAVAHKIEYIHANDNITKVSTLKMIRSMIFSWLRKKFL